MKCLKRLTSIILALSMLCGMLLVQMPVGAAATPLIDTDFNDASYVDGETDLLTVWPQKGTVNSNVSATFAVEDEKRTMKLAAPQGASAKEIIKDFDVVSSGVVSLKYSVKFANMTGSKALIVSLYGSTNKGTDQLSLYHKPGSAGTYFNGENTDGAEIYLKNLDTNAWHDFELVYNINTQEMALYKEGNREIDFFVKPESNTKITLTDKVGYASFYLEKDTAKAPYVFFDYIKADSMTAAEFDAGKITAPVYDADANTVSLQATGDTGSTITWNDPQNIVAADGSVAQPVADTEVTLTATVTDGVGETAEAPFTLTIPGTGAVSGDSGNAEEDAKALTLNKQITTADALPTEGESGSKITWTADVVGIIVDNNNVLPEDGAQKVTFTASLKGAEETPVTKTFKDIFVGSPQQLSKYDADALAPVYYGRKRIDLSSTGEAGSSITWSVEGANIETSDDPETTNTNELGIVTVTDSLQRAKLTATVTYAEAAPEVRTFSFTIPSKSQPLYEDVEYPAAADGTSIGGFNGWELKKSDAAIDDTEAEIKTDDNSNKYFSIKRTAKPGGDSKQYTMTKRFPAIIGGKAKISFDVMLKASTGGGKRFYLGLGGSDIDFQSSRIKIDSTEIEKGYWKDNEYNKVEIIVNFADSTAEFIINGTSEGTLSLPKCGGLIEEISIVTNRANGSSGDELCFDNIVAEAIPVDVSIAAVNFTDASGNKVVGKVDGGKIAGLTVSANNDVIDSAWIVAAVYVDDELFSVATGKAEGMTQYGNTDVTFQAPAKLPEDASTAEIKIFAMDSVSTLKPLTFPAEYMRADSKLKFVMLGDSMMCNYNAEKTNKIGVGMVIGDYFDSAKVEALNLGRSGASTETYYENAGNSTGSLQANLSEINNGDYVFIMFGHNDTTKAEKGTTLEEYRDYLTKMIIMVRTRGAVPVLLSPIVRYEWKEGNTELDNDALAERTAEMKNLADTLNVKYIDVNTYTKNLIEGYGYDSDAAKAFYLLDADKKDGFVVDSTDSFTGSDGWDTTHMTETGAREVASYIASRINSKNWLPAGYYIGQ